MKKIYMLAVMLSACYWVQAQPFTEIWQKVASGADYSWFTPDNNVVSIDYNPATDKLLVSKRNDRIFIINPATGAEEGTLNTTGMGSEAFKFNKIRVTTDGVIYGISLATGAGQCKIYRWANQAAAPTLCADFAVTERTGDSFGLSGTGNNTILYASGAASAGGVNGSINIYMLNTVNGLNFFVESKINVATGVTGVTQWANRAIDPVTNGLTSDLWINGGGAPARRITVGDKVSGVRTGTLAFTIADGVGNGQASVGYGGLRHLTTPNGKKFLIFAGGNNSNAGSRMKTLEVSDEASVKTYGLDSLWTDVLGEYITNANGTGDAAFKQESNGEYTVFYLSTNNGIAATKSGLEILPVTMSEFKAGMEGNRVQLTWTTAAENNNHGFYVERSGNGTDFSRIGFVPSLAPDGNSKLPLDYRFTDNSGTSGRKYYRLQQVDKDGRSTYTAVRWVEKGNNLSFTASLRTNPVVNNISISILSQEKSDIRIALVNASGAVLQSVGRAVDAGETIVDMPAAQLPKGVYFVNITDGTQKGKPLTLRVIK